MSFTASTAPNSGHYFFNFQQLNKPLLIFLFFLLGGAVRSSAQVNLVPNPSFELYDTCPDVVVTNYFDGYVTSWKKYAGSPEYFNSCAAQGLGRGVPCNAAGYQQPATGNAYAGLYTYESGNPDIREFIGIQLSFPLLIGTKYYVAFKTSLAIDTNHVFNYATSNIGARFSSVPYSFDNPAPVDNWAQVFNTNVITDTSGWTTVQGSFIADSAYQYVTIGNFFTDSATTLVYMQDTLYDISAYYYIDDIYVSTDSFNGIAPHQIDNILNIYPNPATDYFVIEMPDIPIGQSASFTIYDVLGKTIDEKWGVFSEGRYLLQRNGMRSGVYLLKIEAGDSVFFRRIIFQ